MNPSDLKKSLLDDKLDMEEKIFGFNTDLESLLDDVENTREQKRACEKVLRYIDTTLEQLAAEQKELSAGIEKTQESK